MPPATITCLCRPGVLTSVERTKPQLLMRGPQKAAASAIGSCALLGGVWRHGAVFHLPALLQPLPLTWNSFCASGKQLIFPDACPAGPLQVFPYSPFLRDPLCPVPLTLTGLGILAPKQVRGQELCPFLSIPQCLAHSKCPMLADVYRFPSLAINPRGLEAHPTPLPHGGSQAHSWPQLESGRPKVNVLGRVQEISRKREKR